MSIRLPQLPLAQVDNHTYFFLNNYLCICQPLINPDDTVEGKRLVKHVGVVTDPYVVITSTYDWYDDNSIVQLLCQ